MNKIPFAKALLFLVTCIFSTSNCNAQKDTTEAPFEHFHSPCFESEYPKIMNLPDSFGLKTQKQYALFFAYCIFDSTGVILEIKPFSIYIKNKDDNNLIKQYNYYQKEGKNISEKEALKYYYWAIQSLPAVTKIKRFPPHIRCGEKITNSNSAALDLRLE